MTEHIANIALQQTARTVAQVGRNFHAAAPKRATVARVGIGARILRALGF